MEFLRKMFRSNNNETEEVDNQVLKQPLINAEKEVKFMKAWCCKCKKMQDMKDDKIVDMISTKAQGMKRASGNCAVCGTKMSKILPKEKKVTE